MSVARHSGYHRGRGRRDENRSGETLSVSALAAGVYHDVVAGATPEQLDRARRASEARRVYRAWNAVCAGTTEGDHVTGLRYLPDDNKLLVYLDDAVWTQEMTMLREIIRVRMEREGVALDGFMFRTSKPSYQSRAARRSSSFAPSAPKPSAPHVDLDGAEEAALDAQVAGIADDRLRRSLRKAMKASMEWKKGIDAQNKA